MNLSSPSFESGGYIPATYAQFGNNVSPPLSIENVPSKARSLVLILDDPDAPKGTFTHWVLFNVDPKISNIREGEIPRGALQGLNSRNEAKYIGPKPPYGEHRYFFKLYALDDRLDLPNGATRAEVEKALQSHVIETAQAMGRYAAAERMVSADR
jgi:Raf kinase inhibitor-like YbhB/YbcL family protein